MNFLELEGNRFIAISSVQEVRLTGEKRVIECDYLADGRLVRGIVFAEPPPPDNPELPQTTGEAAAIYEALLTSGQVLRPTALLLEPEPEPEPQAETQLELEPEPVLEPEPPADAEGEPQADGEAEPEPEATAEEAPPRKVVRRRKRTEE